jgi:hypothetical protein
LKASYEDDFVLHFVMELCEGRDLFEKIMVREHYKEKPVTIKRIIV